MAALLSLCVDLWQVEFGAAGAGQVVMATEQQQMVAGQTVMMGTSEVCLVAVFVLMFVVLRK